MSSSLESIGELIDSHGLTIADIEFILKYLVREKISPQLAMRRIKSFDVLKAKLEDNSDQEIIKELKEQLDNQGKAYQTDLEEKEKILQSQIDEKEMVLKNLITEKTT